MPQSYDAQGKPLPPISYDAQGKPLPTVAIAPPPSRGPKPPTAGRGSSFDLAAAQGSLPGKALGAVANTGVDLVAHPIENAPTWGALGAAALTGGTSLIPVVAGALGGSAVKNIGRVASNEPIQSAPEVGVDMLLNVFAPELAGKVLKVGGKAAAWLSRNLTGASLKPDAQVLAKLVNPVTGAKFDTPGEAAEYFKSKALEIGKGRPGSSEYAKDITGKITQERAAKEAELSAARGTQIPASIIPSNFNDLLHKALSAPDPHAALKQIDDTLQTYLNRQQLIPNSVKSATGLPAHQSIRPGSFDVTEVDDMLRRLDADLNKSYSTNAQKTQMGGRVPPDYDMDALKQIRSNLSTALESAVPAIQGPNERMSRMIPFAQAATEATVPVWSAPRMRVASGGSSPTVQLYDYFTRDVTSHAIRPLEGAAKGLDSVAASFPNIARFILSQQRGIPPPPKR